MRDVATQLSEWGSFVVNSRNQLSDFMRLISGVDPWGQITLGDLTLGPSGQLQDAAFLSDRT